MAKARLRRGIELVKLKNRIEALKIQEDDPDNTDMQADPEVPSPVPEAAPGQVDGPAGPSSSAKQTIQKVKGAIFREVVMAKVREMRQQEEDDRKVEEVAKHPTM